MKNRMGAGASTTVVVLLSIFAVVFLSGAYVTFTQNGSATPTSSTTTSASIQGVVTGYVTVGPSQPVCPVNQNCTVNMTGYSLVFEQQCAGSASDCPKEVAQLSPGGHYSILLPPGEYTVTGLLPSCGWLGCASAFPRTVTVQGGMQLVFNVDIDTGIR